LQITLEPDTLTPDEEARWTDLVATKYATDAWTLRK
jgi:lipoate-protein ligase A